MLPNIAQCLLEPLSYRTAMSLHDFGMLNRRYNTLVEISHLIPKKAVSK